MSGAARDVKPRRRLAGAARESWRRKLMARPHASARAAQVMQEDPDIVSYVLQATLSFDPAYWLVQARAAGIGVYLHLAGDDPAEERSPHFPDGIVSFVTGLADPHLCRALLGWMNGTKGAFAAVCRELRRERAARCRGDGGAPGGAP